MFYSVKFRSSRKTSEEKRMFKSQGKVGIKGNLDLLSQLGIDFIVRLSQVLTVNVD